MGLPSSCGVQKFCVRVCRIKDTKDTGTYLRCRRNKVIFFVKTDLVSGHTDRYWDKSIP